MIGIYYSSNAFSQNGLSCYNKPFALPLRTVYCNFWNQCLEHVLVYAGMRLQGRFSVLKQGSRQCNVQYDSGWPAILRTHYNDVKMGAIASQTTSLTIVYWIVYSDADQRKHQSSASLAFVRKFTGDHHVFSLSNEINCWLTLVFHNILS